MEIFGTPVTVHVPVYIQGKKKKKKNVLTASS
jgi:hypothetical protein